MPFPHARSHGRNAHAVRSLGSTAWARSPARRAQLQPMRRAILPTLRTAATTKDRHPCGIVSRHHNRRRRGPWVGDAPTPCPPTRRRRSCFVHCRPSTTHRVVDCRHCRASKRSQHAAYAPGHRRCAGTQMFPAASHVWRNQCFSSGASPCIARTVLRWCATRYHIGGSKSPPARRLIPQPLYRSLRPSDHVQ
jgi:hypothetical protein